MYSSEVNMADWTKLLNADKRSPSRGKEKARAEGRFEIERDYDRILFSTPVRRMADKTQLFPLEQNDGVHTRLTHSHEVSALARSIGIDLAARFAGPLGLDGSVETLRNLAAVMAAVGLVHDIGNPPFGHQGERAIRSWFDCQIKSHPKDFGDQSPEDERLRQDFLHWEGNAQTFRLIARLQGPDEFGMNLTYATLAVALKYTASAADFKADAPNAGIHKPGFFASEKAIARDVWEKTGLNQAQRHPLAYLVEACDDIAYSVIDTEDTAARKRLASYEDLHDHLSQPALQSDEVIKSVRDSTAAERRKLLGMERERPLSPAEVNSATMQEFRVTAISSMVRAVLGTFVGNFAVIASGGFSGDLLDGGKAAALRHSLKDGFLPRVAFADRSVAEIELAGSTVISRLMDELWAATTGCDGTPKWKPRDPRAAYVYSRVSENYRRAFESNAANLPLWYRRAQLLTDMVSGMTDSFAVTLLEQLERFRKRDAPPENLGSSELE